MRCPDLYLGIGAKALRGRWDLIGNGQVIVSQSAAFHDPLGEHRRQAGGDDFLLSLGDVILDAAEHDEVVIEVEDRITGAPVAVARLADGADVDEIL